MHRLLRLVVVLGVLLSLPSSAFAERVVLLVTDEESGEFVEGARVHIASGGETYDAYSSFAGTVDVEVAGSDAAVEIEHLAYAPRSFEMELTEREPRRVEMERVAFPGDEFVFFELSFHAQCVYSNVALPNAEITIERADEPNGPPVTTYTVMTDEYGRIELNGLFPGHYRFHVEKEGWLELDYPDSGTFALTEGHSASVGLEPFKNQLAFEVIGFEPREFGGEVTSIDDVLVEVTGLTLDGEQEAVPPQGKHTSMGVVDWQTLPPIPHEVRFTKLGYEPLTMVVQPEDLNTFETIQVDLEYIESGATFEIDTVLHADALNSTPTVSVTGLEGTATEGVDQFVDSVVNSDGTYVAEIEHLLPGRYDVEVEFVGAAAGDADSGSIDAGSQRSGVLSVRHPTTIEVTLGGNETVEVDLPIQRARVSGQLVALDRFVDPAGISSFDPNSDNDRVLTPLAQGGVEVHFVSHPSFQHLPEEEREVIVTTDASGRFSANLLPSRYGITIPDLPEYSGNEIILTQSNSRDPFPAMNERQPWPYPAPWPHPSHIREYHGVPALFWAGDYDLKLILHPNTIQLVTTVLLGASDMTTVVSAQSGPALTFGRTNVLETSPPVVADGTGTHIGTLVSPQSGTYRIDDLPPGSHVITASGAEYVSNGITEVVPSFGPPGSYPAVDPFDPTFRRAGARYQADGFITLDWRPPRVDEGSQPVDAPAFVTYQVQTVARDGEEVTGVDVELVDESTTHTVTTPGAQTVEGSAALTVVTPGWATLSRKNRLIDNGTLEVTFVVERQMGVSGTITIGGAQPNAEIGVKVTDRFGRVLARGASDADGTYGLTAQTMEVFIVIDSPGFEPVRLRRPPGNPDIEEDIDLVPLQPPTITSIEIDRYGVFIPGVYHARDPSGEMFIPHYEALTATFKIEANAQSVQYDVERFDGEPGPTTVTFEDEVDEVWLLDRRLFPAGYLATPPDEVQPLEMNDPFTYAHARALGAKIGNRIDNLEPFPVVRVFGSKELDGTWTGQLNLWEMPRGAFDFVAVAITRAGAVRVLEYVPPQGEPPLRGAQLPNWAVTVLQVLGGIANYVPVKMFPLTGFAPKGTMIPNSAGITGTITESSGKLTYKYGLAVEFAKSQATPTEGLLALTSKNLGYELLGALNFQLDGATGRAGFDGGGSLSVEYARSKKLGTPAIFKRVLTRGGVPEVSFKPMVGTTLQATQALGLEGEPLPEYLFTRIDDGSLATTTKFNLRPYLPLIGQIGVVLLTTTALNVEYKALINTLVSGKFTETFLSLGSSGMTTTGGGPPPRQGFLGQDLKLPPDQTTIGTGAGGGIEVTLGDVLGGSASVTFSISLQLNPMDIWPLFNRVMVGVKLEAKVMAKVSAFEVERVFSHEFKQDWQIGTTSYFDLQPSHRTTRIVTPPAAAPSDFDGEETVVQDLYEAGALAATDSGVAWVEAEDDQTTLQFSRRSDDGLEAPLTVATAAGIADVVAIDYDGGLALVWTEIAGAPGDLLAGGLVKYAVSSDDGESFGDPAKLSTFDAMPRSLRGVESGGEAVVTWQVPQMYALDRMSTVHAATARGAEFSDAEVVTEDREILSFGLSVGTDAAIASLGLPESHERWSYDGSGWTLLAPEVDEEGEEETVWASAAAGDAEVVAPKTGGLWWRRDGERKLVSEEPVNSAREIAVVPAGEGHLVAWLDRMDADGVYYAFVDAEGEVVEGPRNAAPDSVARFSELHAVKTSDGADLYFRSDFEETDRLDQIVVASGVEPLAPDFREEPGGPGDTNDENEDDGAGGGSGDGCCATTASPDDGRVVTLFLVVVVLLVRRRRRVVRR